MSAKPKVLHCITVYNGRAFVPAAIKSALRLDQSEADIDVLVLDDASPEPGWSDELRRFCDDVGALYYRSPRNLGIPRNVNLGLLTALRNNYDYVVISNSDVLYPAGLIPNMLAVSRQDGVGSVTAWSNNVSVYSIPNDDPDSYLANQGVVDWLNAVLQGHFGDAAMDIPAGISFCILMSTDVVRRVGLMDPCFGRGYCEETDWSLRSLAAGYRICLAPGTFVYHQGRGSNLEAGLVSAHSTTVPRNEAIIDLRYPQFRTQVDAFMGSGVLESAHEDAVKRIVKDAGKQFGYEIHVGWLARSRGQSDGVVATVAPELGGSPCRLSFRGFELDLALDPLDPGTTLREFFGCDPSGVNLLDRGRVAEALRSKFANGVREAYNLYPVRI